jgi:hypothetical protein
MKTLRPALFLALVAVTSSCGGAAPPDHTPPTNTAKKVDVSIASVTLADDCGTGPTTMPSEPAAAADISAGASMSQAYRACQQSSIQLRVENSTAEASTVAIQKIELIDERGAMVAELTPREPSRWVDDSYQAWDQEVAPSELLQVSYALSAPNVARGASYTVRVTVSSADGERTLEQKTTLHAEASLPPDVVT